jgi:hypothetical protein
MNKYKSMKVQHPQVQQDRRKPLTEFIKEGQVNLKHGETYILTDMAATSDNKLLLCVLVYCLLKPILTETFQLSLSLFFRHLFLGLMLPQLLAVVEGHRYLLVALI